MKKRSKLVIRRHSTQKEPPSPGLPSTLSGDKKERKLFKPYYDHDAIIKLLMDGYGPTDIRLAIGCSRRLIYNIIDKMSENQVLEMKSARTVKDLEKIRDKRKRDHKWISYGGGWSEEEQQTDE